MQKITPFLWFNDKAEEAMHFYTSIFKNSRIGKVSRFGEGGPGPKGAVISARLAERQGRAVVADHSFHSWNHVARQGPCEIATGHAGHASNEQNRD